jgi:hypothetical protein
VVRRAEEGEAQVKNYCKCPAGTAVRLVQGRDNWRVEQCTACDRRWKTVDGVLQGRVTLQPATPLVVRLMRLQGRTVRQICAALLMSTKTVVAALRRPAP